MSSALPLNVLYEDNHLLVVNKPAMLPTMGVSSPKVSLLDVAKRYVAEKYNKPGNVYLGVVSRLDAPVTGVVILARTSKAARRLTSQFRERQVEKIYWAVVAGVPDRPTETLQHHLCKDDRHRRMHVTHPDNPDAQLARLHYQALASHGDACLLEVQLETGRKHQIRVQLAKIGHPVWGDRKYGSQHAFSSGIALHARRLTLQHPVRDESLQFEAPLPASWLSHKQIARVL